MSSSPRLISCFYEVFAVVYLSGELRLAVVFKVGNELVTGRELKYDAPPYMLLPYLVMRPLRMFA